MAIDYPDFSLFELPALETRYKNSSEYMRKYFFQNFPYPPTLEPGAEFLN